MTHYKQVYWSAWDGGDWEVFLNDAWDDGWELVTYSVDRNPDGTIGGRWATFKRRHP